MAALEQTGTGVSFLRFGTLAVDSQNAQEPMPDANAEDSSPNSGIL